MLICSYIFATGNPLIHLGTSGPARASALTSFGVASIPTPIRIFKSVCNPLRPERGSLAILALWITRKYPFRESRLDAATSRLGSRRYHVISTTITFCVLLPPPLLGCRPHFQLSRILSSGQWHRSIPWWETHLLVLLASLAHPLLGMGLKGEAPWAHSQADMLSRKRRLWSGK